MALERRAAVLGVVTAAVSAGAVWCYGVWTGHLLDLRAGYEICGFDRTQPHGYGGSWLPLHSVCTRSDGSSFDLVPVYVNPLILVLLATAAVFAVRAVLAHRRDRATD